MAPAPANATSLGCWIQFATRRAKIFATPLSSPEYRFPTTTDASSLSHSAIFSRYSKIHKRLVEEIDGESDKVSPAPDKIL
jgi:hypothetical protein